MTDYFREQTTTQSEVLWNNNEEIVARLQNGDADSMQDLWNANKGLLAHFALLFLPYMECRSDLDMDDLMQAGCIGLYKAASKYDPSRGAKFSTYAAYHIKNEMRRTVGIGSKRDPMFMALSLDAPLTSDNGENRTLGDTLAAEKQFDNLETENLWDVVRTALMRLIDDGIRCALWERHWNKQSNVQTSVRYGIPAEEVQGLIQRGYTLLRRDDTLREWANIYGYAC